MIELSIALASFSVGTLIGIYATDIKWIYCAKSGFRRSVKGKLYTVKETATE